MNRDSLRVQADTANMVPNMTAIAIDHDEVVDTTVTLCTFKIGFFLILLLHDEGKGSCEQILHRIAMAVEE